MSDINVLFAINQTTFNLLKQNFQRDEAGNRLRTDLTDAQAQKLRTSISGHWRTPNIAGTDYHVASWYVPSKTPEDSQELTWVKFLTDKYPNKFHIIGAWNKDGSMYGTTIVPPVYDEEGNETSPESVTGSPVYPIHAQYMKIFPDDVTYDEQGNETSRTPASAPKNVNKILGWKDRRWS